MVNDVDNDVNNDVDNDVDNDMEVSAARCNLGMALLDLGGAANKAEAKVHLDLALALNSDNEQAQVRPSPVRAAPFNH